MSLEELAFPVIHPHESAAHNGHATPRHRLRGPLWPAVEMWTNTAPKRLRNKSACKTPIKSWARWCEYLGQRKQPRTIERCLQTKCSPLAWGVSESVRLLLQSWDKAFNQAKQALRIGKKQKSADEKTAAAAELLQLIADWKHAARIAADSTEVLWAYQAVAMARALPELAWYLATDQWWALVDELASVAREAVAMSVLEQPLVAQLLAAELSLTLAYQLPELVHCRDLFSAAQQALATGIVELLDGEGVIHQSHWAMQRPLVALWTRCRALQAGLPDKVMDAETARQYTLAVCELARATRSGGGQLLGAFGKDKADSREVRELLAAAYLTVPDLRKKKTAAKFLRSLCNGKAEIPAGSAETSPTADEEKPRDYAASSVNSEWAQVAIFRRSWKPRDPLLACSYARDQVSIEIATDRETLFGGSWAGSLQVNGQTLAVQSPWREVCQTSDNDADYLELELQLERGYKIQRQMCLGRKERFVYLCDSVLGYDSGSLSYEQNLRLAPGIAVNQDAEMREVTLTGKEPCARVLPLALPEWRSEQRQGELRFGESSLTLTSHSMGRNLCSPLWIDLDPKRHAKPLTWRALTVAENRVICTADVARGWRVQIAEKQWLIYRALGSRGNRTILGHNMISEFLLAQFKDGKTTNLVEIE